MPNSLPAVWRCDGRQPKKTFYFLGMSEKNINFADKTTQQEAMTPHFFSLNK
jgi:hypothetical protein